MQCSGLVWRFKSGQQQQQPPPILAPSLFLSHTVFRAKRKILHRKKKIASPQRRTAPITNRECTPGYRVALREKKWQEKNVGGAAGCCAQDMTRWFVCAIAALTSPQRRWLRLLHALGSIGYYE
jgi:hypothetical protein